MGNARNYKIENEKTYLKFENSCFAEGLSKARVRKYRFLLRNISNFLRIPYEKATRDDIERVTRELEQSKYGEWTKSDHRVALKKFYKWIRKTEYSYPPEVRWIKTRIKKEDMRLPEEILNEEEIKSLMDACTNIRDRMFVSVLYESGCRIGEIFSLKVRNVEFDEYGAVLRVHGKTGSRRIRLVNSVPLLTKWMADHSRKNEPDAPFLVGLVKWGGEVRQLTHGGVLKLLRCAAKRAGIKKRVNPHSFRHARATHLASWMTDAQMCLYFGWSFGSDMPRTYYHLSGKDLDDTILRMHGKKMDSEKKDPLQPIVCNRCQTANPADSPICGKCGLPFSEKLALEMENKQAELARLLKNPEVIEKMIDQRVRELLAEKGVKYGQ